VAIFLVRHGETDANAARVLQTPDAELSARGREQAWRLARRLREAGVARVLSSDLRRAAQTAEALAAATGAPLELDARLQERNFGALRGRAWAELEVDVFAPDYEPPEGESWARFHARVDAAWERVAELAAATAPNLAVVTHGLVCASLATRVLRLEAGRAGPLAFANTALTIVDAAPPWRVRLLACTAHLA
jgi:broad specificity phosphatase PhoE